MDDINGEKRYPEPLSMTIAGQEVEGSFTPCRARNPLFLSIHLLLLHPYSGVTFFGFEDFFCVVELE